MKGTRKLKLASLAVILAAVALVPAVQAAEVHASLTLDNDGTDTPVGTITATPGVYLVAFYVRLDITGQAGGGRNGGGTIYVCNYMVLAVDGSYFCNNSAVSVALPGGVNFTLNKDINGDGQDDLPMYIPVTLRVEEGIDCPETYSLAEPMTTSGAADFGDDSNGDAIKALQLFFQVHVDCAAWQGCSHGHWKNHVDSWPEGRNPGDPIGTVFTVPGALSGLTLLSAMQFKGPGDTLDDAKRILLQQAVASLLNAEHDDINFPMDSASLVAAVNAALASSDRDAILALKDELDTKNNLGCPLY
jgi:hypothetical protein